MRWVTCVTLVLGASGCFSGNNAAGLPCDNDDQCGTELRCEMGVCGGPSTTSEDTTTQSTTTMTTEASTLGTSSTTPTSSTTADTTNDSGSSSSPTSTESGSTGDPLPSCGPPPDLSVCSPRMGRLARTVDVRVHDLPDEENPSAATIGDYVGDTSLDVAIGSHTTRTITILEGDGAGALTIVETSPPTADLLVDLVETDLECDGVRDFLTVGYEARINRFTLEGDQLTPGSAIAVDPGGYSLAVGDIVEGDDGRPEVVVAQGSAWGTDGLQVIGISNGDLLAHGSIGSYSGTSPWEVGLVDLGYGGGVRAFIANGSDNEPTTQPPYDHRVEVLRFNDWDPVEDVDGPVADDFQNPFALAFGTFTAPNAGIEIAVAEKFIAGPGEESQVPGRVRIFGVEPGRDQVFVERDNFPVGVGPRAMASADFDCDGLHDLVISNSGNGLVGNGVLQIWWGGSFDAEPAVPVDTLGGGGTRIAVGDLDGDGAPEAAVPDWAMPRMHVVGVD